MADERTVALDCDQYEDLKETVVKTLKAEPKLPGKSGKSTTRSRRH